MTAIGSVKKSPFQEFKDAICFPLRFLLPHGTTAALGLTSLQEERVRVCLDFAEPPLLDIACGEANAFARRVKGGYGLDLVLLNDLDICADAYRLPFRDKTFQTVSFIGSINYMKDVDAALREAGRILKPGGRLLVTTTGVFFSRIRHTCAFWNKRHNYIVRGMRYGYSDRELRQILERNGFAVVSRRKYFCGISTLFVSSLTL